MPFQIGNKLGKGRPKGSGGGLKDYDRRRFAAMSDKEKEAFLLTISPELRYRMAEGNPANDLNVDGEIRLPIYLPAELLAKNSLPENKNDIPQIENKEE